VQRSKLKWDCHYSTIPSQNSSQGTPIIRAKLQHKATSSAKPSGPAISGQRTALTPQRRTFLGRIGTFRATRDDPQEQTHHLQGGTCSPVGLPRGLPRHALPHGKLHRPRRAPGRPRSPQPRASRLTAPSRPPVVPPDHRRRGCAGCAVLCRGRAASRPRRGGGF